MDPWNKGEKIPGFVPRFSIEEGILLTYKENRDEYVSEEKPT